MEQQDSNPGCPAPELILWIMLCCSASQKSPVANIRKYQEANNILITPTHPLPTPEEFKFFSILHGSYGDDIFTEILICVIISFNAQNSLYISSRVLYNTCLWVNVFMCVCACIYVWVWGSVSRHMVFQEDFFCFPLKTFFNLHEMIWTGFSFWGL